MRGLGAAASSEPVDWPQFHFDAAHTGFNPYENLLSPSTLAAGVALRWTGHTTGYIYASPAVVDGVVYVTGDVLGETQFLYAFDAAATSNCSGTPAQCEPLWTAVTGGLLQSSPAVVNGVVFVTSREPKLYAFDAAGVINCAGSPKACTPLWTAGLGGQVVAASPTVANGVVYVASSAKSYAFDGAGSIGCAGVPKTCAPLWTTTATASAQHAPTVANGMVYMGSDADHSLNVFDAAGNINCTGAPKTCAPLWTGPKGYIAPAVANGLVYVGGEGGLYAFDAAGSTSCGGTPKTCAPLWTAVVGAPLTTPAVAYGFVYMATLGGLYAVDAAGSTNCAGTPKICAPLWTGTVAANDSFSGGSPAVADGVVYVYSHWNRLYAYDAAGNLNCAGTPKTCTALWTTTVPTTSTETSPVVINGMVYVGAAPDLYAYGPTPPVSLLPQPIRLADTRIMGGPISSGSSRCFQVYGTPGIPVDALGVVMNVTGTGYSAPGWLTVYPNGQPVPSTSTVNFEPNAYAIANNAIARIGNDRQVCVNVGTVNNALGSAHVILDVTGYLTSTSNTQISLLSQPQRVADTRSSGGLLNGTSRCFAIAGQAGAPPDAAGALLNVTGVGYTAPGWLTLYPSGEPVPGTSTLNVDPRSYAIANGAIARIGSGGQVCVSFGSVNNVPANSNVIVDVTGYLASSSAPQLSLLARPQRLVDTRASGGPIPTGGSRCFPLAGQAGIPPNAAGVIVNVTGVGYTRPGWLTLYPGNQPLPATSTLNFDTVEYAIANGAIIKLGSNGHACVGVGTVNSMPGASEAILDATGYLASPVLP